MESKNCKKCGKVMIVKDGKFGKFYACSGYPHCKTTEKFIFTAEDIKPISLVKFNPTAKQSAIFHFMSELKKNLIIKARPGSGKTSTMIQGLEYIDSTLSVLMVAFNKTIATELTNRIQVKNATAGTLHSIGLRLCKSIYGNQIKVKADKYNDIIMTCGLIEEDKRKGFINPIKKILSLLNSNLLDITEENLKELDSMYNLEFEINSQIIQVLQYVKAEGIKQANQCVDFDDMINLPLAHDIKPITEVLICDESQDMSKSRLMLISKLAKKYIFVGDENQSIYGFTGADSLSMENIKSQFNCEELSLDETFRIPQNIVKELNNLFPQITLTSNKAGGTIETINESSLIETIIKHDKVNILCRNNSPMVKPVYELIRSGKKAVIRGADISQGLTNLIMRVNRESIQVMIESLEKYYNGLCEKFANAKNKSFLDVIEDQIKTINAICESDEVKTVNDLLVKINSLFSDNESGYDYIFSTIHKSKGTESEVVIIYQPELIGCKAKTEEEIKQENNLKWVAMSRSLNILYMTVKQ